ncbi:GNAT family N-acetyltransferase [Rhodobacteraceae bacterium D3-12]|nr:GNAT family N-acetyltransferase [Rhodobacteraceae bacterium D3-12]
MGGLFHCSAQISTLIAATGADSADATRNGTHSVGRGAGKYWPKTFSLRTCFICLINHDLGYPCVNSSMTSDDAPPPVPTLPPPRLPPPSLSQSRLYADVLQSMGRDVRTLTLGSIGLARLILRSAGPFGKIGLIPGGVQWADTSSQAARADALRALPALTRNHGVRVLLCNSVSAMDENIFEKNFHLPVLSAGFHAELDLTQSSEIRRKNLHGKWRNRLKKSENSDITITHSRFSPHAHNWLLTAEQTQRRARSYRALPLNFLLIAAQIAPDSVRVFVASIHGKPLAGIIFLIHDKAATYHIATTTDQGRAHSVHALLLWQATDWLAKGGVTRLDLGPVETEHPPGHARFKLGTGARPVQRGATVLYARSIAPLGWLNATFNRKAAHAAAMQSDLSCH